MFQSFCYFTWLACLWKWHVGWVILEKVDWWPSLPGGQILTLGAIWGPFHCHLLEDRYSQLMIHNSILEKECGHMTFNPPKSNQFVPESSLIVCPQFEESPSWHSQEWDTTKPHLPWPSKLWPPKSNQFILGSKFVPNLKKLPRGALENGTGQRTTWKLRNAIERTHLLKEALC